MANRTAKTASAPKTRFAGIGETIQSPRAMIEVPEAARDFVKNGAGIVQQRANDLQANAEKVTASVETVAVGAVAEIAKVSRAMQQAWFEDVQAYVANVGTLAGATCLSEAVRSQTEFLRARGDVAMARAKASGEYLNAMATSGAAKLREGLAGANLFVRQAA